MNKHQTLKRILDDKYLVLIVSFIAVFALLLIYKLGSVPKIFVDERSYMDEVQSLLYTGSDLNNLVRPIYFKGPFGNGQSITYALFAVPFTKLFGFSVLKFRLPMILLTLINLILILFYLTPHKKSPRLQFWISLAFVTAPWMFISNRWVLDCNIAPIMLSIGVISLLQSLKPNSSTIQRLLSTTLSAIFITFSVYGYVAGWLFIPVFLLFLAISLIKQSHLSIKWLLVYSVQVIILCLPMIAFAYHFLVLHSAKDISWGPFTFPGMAMQRSNSFIDFNDPQGIMHAIVINVTTGFQTYMQGFDHLVWNSVSGFGVVFPVFLIFVLIGILTPKNILSPNQLLFKRVLCIELLAFIPSLLVVRPNFNHWTFLNIPLILLVGYGMYYASLQIGKRYSISIVTITVIIFGIFLTNYYFTDNSYFVNGSPMTSSQSLQSDKVNKIPAKKIKQVEEMRH